MTQPDIIKFVKKLFLFLPLALGLGLPLTLLHLSGEEITADAIIKKQEDRSRLVLLGMLYNNITEYYKPLAVITLKPQVIALGNSRVMQFRSAFFKEETKFFNTGGAVLCVNDFKRVLDLIPKGQEPKLMLVGLDHSFFNATFNKTFPGADLRKPPLFANTPHILRSLIKDLLHQHISLSQLLQAPGNHKYGIGAILNNSGYRNDGSRYDGKIIEHPDSPDAQNRFNAARDEIANGTKRFPFGALPDPSAIAVLREFLDECAKRHIHVIGFLPPFTHEAYTQLQSMGEAHADVFQLNHLFSTLLSEYNFSFFDFSDLAWLGASDEEAIDGYHGSEKAYLRLFLVMIQQDSLLRHYAQDPAYLTQRLLASTNPFCVFNNDEF